MKIFDYKIVNCRPKGKGIVLFLAEISHWFVERDKKSWPLFSLETSSIYLLERSLKEKEP